MGRLHAFIPRFGQPLNPPSAFRRRLLLAVLVLVTAGNYLVWFAWDRRKLSDGQLSGPYETWQVVGAAAVLGLLGVAAGWAKIGVNGTFVVSLVFAAGFAWSFATDTGAYNDGLWPVGVCLIAGATLLGVGATSAAAYTVRRALGQSPDEADVYQLIEWAFIRGLLPGEREDWLATATSEPLPIVMASMREHLAGAPVPSIPRRFRALLRSGDVDHLQQPSKT